jgi:hypothetical protein
MVPMVGNYCGLTMTSGLFHPNIDWRFCPHRNFDIFQDDLEDMFCHGNSAWRHIRGYKEVCAFG